MGQVNRHLRDVADHFENSHRLRTLICEYHVAVVKFCTVLVKHTERNPLGRFVYSLNASVLTDFQTAIKEQGTAVQQEITILMAREVRDNLQSSSALKNIAVGQGQRAQRQRTATVKRAVLDHCSVYDYENSWRQIRKAGVATVQRGDFIKWRQEQGRATLLVIGKLGYGKSVLLANIVDDLHLNTLPNTCTIAYFFCKHDDAQSLIPKTILGCILRQLLQSLPDLDRLEPILDLSRSMGSLEKVMKELPNLIPRNYRAFVVVDGLDECAHEDKLEVLSALKVLQDRLEIHLCSSVRLTSDTPPHAGYETLTNLMKLHMSDDNSDLQAFINLELTARLEARNIVLCDPYLILDIQKKLLSESQGMFLWVVLQIHYLCGMRTDDAIRKALLTLPRTLSETFANILRESARDRQQEQRILLLVLLATRQVLTSEQLREILSVSPGDSVWHPSKVLNNISPVLATCGPLTTVNEENDTIHLLHHSFRQFLEEGANGVFQQTFDGDTAHSVMADRVVTYMTYKIFGQEVSTTVAPSVGGAQASTNIIQSIRPSLVTKMAIHLLRSKRNTMAEVDIGHSLWQHRDQQLTSLEQHPFFEYCKIHWRQHILRISGSDVSVSAALRNFLLNKANDFITDDRDKEVLLLEAILNSNGIAADVIADAWKIEIDGRRMKNNLLLTQLVHSCLVSEGIVEPAPNIMPDEILWVFSMQAAAHGLTKIAMSCLKQAFQRRKRVWNWIFEVLSPHLESMIQNQDTEIYRLLLTSNLCRSRYLEVSHLFPLLERRGLREPLNFFRGLELSVAALDAAIYADSRLLVKATLAESPHQLEREVYLDLARSAFEESRFHAFLVMYGCAVDWNTVTSTIRTGLSQSSIEQEDLRNERELHQRLATTHRDKITLALQPPQAGNLTALMLRLLESGVFSTPEETEALYEQTTKTLKRQSSKLKGAPLVLEELNSLRALLLFILARKVWSQNLCHLTIPEEFFSIRKIMCYLDRLPLDISGLLTLHVDGACAEVLEWGFLQSKYCSGEQAQKTATANEWLWAVSKILASALRHGCMITAKSCLRTITALQTATLVRLSCEYQCNAVHERGLIHVLKLLASEDLDRRLLVDIAPCASFIMEQHSAEELSKINIYGEQDRQQATALEDPIIVDHDERLRWIEKISKQMSVLSMDKHECGETGVPKKVLASLEDAAEKLGTRSIMSFRKDAKAFTGTKLRTFGIRTSAHIPVDHYVGISLSDYIKDRF